MESEDAAEPPKRANQTDSRSIGSAKSIKADEADEDEVEVARMAAINKEIKRVLTEVLPKVVIAWRLLMIFLVRLQAKL
ncbi:unnamed protein product [Triticum turgidum subsp. durum]|uniref:Uncharacterized protein n=1 Tax=Triticum turgidum subsp. durum TaxID=4567 RepID=A0A9R1PVF3_TRITD|nr:unnamed protein product [Triticum turgidum subsp. durum]